MSPIKSYITSGLLTVLIILQAISYRGLYLTASSPYIKANLSSSITKSSSSSDCGITTDHDIERPPVSGNTTDHDIERPPLSGIATDHNTERPSLSGNKVCKLLYDKIGKPFTASSIWTSHFQSILEASKHPSDEAFAHKEWMSVILSTLSPSILKKGTQSTPSYSAMKSMLDIIQKRLEDPESNPPLKVVVFGGSVTEGRGCAEMNNQPLQEKIQEGPKIGGSNCAWPKRFEILIDALVGKGIVKVYNMAVGGTNTNLAYPLVKYWMYPPELKENGPDVVILSYSTNEEHVYPYGKDTTGDTTFANEKRNTIQDFTRAVLESRPCGDPPLLVYMDDYLGNQQNVILGEMTYSNIMVETSRWYDNTMAVSYADVVRRFVYADTSELVFSAAWEKGSKHIIDGHFGMTGHVAMSYVLLFASVHAIGEFCDNHDFVDANLGEKSIITSHQMELVESIPPKLTTDLELLTISETWTSDLMGGKTKECQEDADEKSPCMFSFIAGPAGTVRNTGMLNGYLKPFLVNQTGWNAVEDMGAGGWSRKLGYVASQPNATFTLNLKNIQKEVQVITLYTLKSYGEKWENSLAKFIIKTNVNGVESPLVEFNISGIHNSTSSISYSFEENLKENKVKKGSDIIMDVKLIGGSAFKIIGMMFCNR